MSWSRTIWFHIAVGAAAKKGKQMIVVAAALAIRTRSATRDRRSSSNQPRTIKRVITPQILIVIASPSSAPATIALPGGNESARARGCSSRIAISNAVVAGLSSSVDLSE